MRLKDSLTKADHREQYEYARARLRKRKALMRHFIFFLSGAVLLLVMDLALGFGKDNLPNNWSAYLILFWTFLLLVHTLNVFLLHRFMDKEWEEKQIEKLKSRQMERILEMQKKIAQEYPVPEKNTTNENLRTDTTNDVENSTDHPDHSKYLP